MQTNSCQVAGKVFSLFINIDSMVGGDFERGLAQMKTVTENAG